MFVRGTESRRELLELPSLPVRSSPGTARDASLSRFVGHRMGSMRALLRSAAAQTVLSDIWRSWKGFGEASRGPEDVCAGLRGIGSSSSWAISVGTTDENPIHSRRLEALDY